MDGSGGVLWFHVKLAPFSQINVQKAIYWKEQVWIDALVDTNYNFDVLLTGT